MDKNAIGDSVKQEKEINVLLAQWQTCVEMANSVSQRRDSMNNIFITLNLAIVAAVSFVWNAKTFFLLIAGMVLCVIWILFIRNFKLLNEAKFQVINNLEKELPASPFENEWNKLQLNKKYMDGTKLERTLPITFIILYTAVLLVLLFIK